MASKVIAFGEIGVGILVVAGSATGNLAPMLAALFDPTDLTGATTSTSKSTKTKTASSSGSTANANSANPFSNAAANVKNIFSGLSHGFLKNIHLP